MGVKPRGGSNPLTRIEAATSRPFPCAREASWQGAAHGQILGVHPVLPSQDVRRSIRFYERLGFSLAFWDAEDPAYAATSCTCNGTTLRSGQPSNAR